MLKTFIEVIEVRPGESSGGALACRVALGCVTAPSRTRWPQDAAAEGYFSDYISEVKINLVDPIGLDLRTQGSLRLRRELFWYMPNYLHGAILKSEALV